ncbi:MAG: 50S ribosomal protein L5 [Acidobacteriota bacterium]
MANYVPRLRGKYAKDIIPSLTKEFGYKNVMGVPKLEKITLNMGVGEAKNDIKLLDEAAVDIIGNAAKDFPPIPASISRDSLNYVVPIIFKKKRSQKE